jgi:hypothetical protein
LDFFGVVFEESVDEGRAALSNSAIDDHRARSADFFEATAVPSDWGDFFAVEGRRLCSDFLQDADDVHVRFIIDLVPFPIRRSAWTILTQDSHIDLGRPSCWVKFWTWSNHGLPFGGDGWIEYGDWIE